MLEIVLGAALLAQGIENHQRQSPDDHTGPFRRYGFEEAIVELQPVDRAIPLAPERWGYVARAGFGDVFFTHVTAQNREGHLVSVASFANACCINAYYAFDVNGDGFNEILVEWSDEQGFSYQLYGLTPPMIPGGSTRWAELLQISDTDTHEGDLYFTRIQSGSGQLIATRMTNLGDHYVNGDEPEFATRCWTWPPADYPDGVSTSTACSDLPAQNVRRTHQVFMPLLRPEVADYDGFPWPDGHSRSGAEQD